MEVTSKTGKRPFFNRTDWASFWTATILSFAVYFLTLGPSVGLEDSGELAVAGDHLGVPHPPGYPIWSMISFCLARVFGFVTFRGQPNPAWAIALGSAIFGALAAGCTAMLITRSIADMLASMGDGDCAADGDCRGAEASSTAGNNALLSFAGGVAGSLIFAFSPVMWSQSTIVEVYSLGAFFLMLVMLLTYRWMRRPSDKLLWITAFVFGLGLTNYQVLLLAALPLIVIIFLRNIALFRDFMLVLIPFGLAATLLKLGSLGQQRDLPKRIPLQMPVAIPNGALLTAGAVAFGLALAVMLAWKVGLRAGSRDRAESRFAAFAWVSGGLLGLSLFLLALAGAFAATGVVGTVNPANVALIEPIKYLRFAMLLVGVIGLSAFAAAFGRNYAGDDAPAPRYLGGAGPASATLFVWPLAGAAVLAAVAFAMALALPDPSVPPGMEAAGVPTLGIGSYNALFAIGLLAMVALSATSRRTLAFALPIAAVEGVLYILVLKGVLLGLTHPSTWWFCAPVIFNFALLAMAALSLPNGVSVAATILASEAGLSFYAYMPIVSDLRNPPMNWGYPRTWEGFKHAITRGQYEAIKPTNIFTMRFVHQVGDYFIDLRRQFTLLLAPFGFLPFAAWRCRRSSGAGVSAPRSLDAEASSPKYRGAGASSPALIAAIALMALAAVLWGVDSFVAESAISDGLASALRLFGAFALAGGVAFALAGGISPMLLSCAFIAAIEVFVVLGNIPAIERNFDASRIDKLFFGGVLLIACCGGLLIVWEQARALLGRIWGARGTTPPHPETGGTTPTPLHFTEPNSEDGRCDTGHAAPVASLFDNVSQQWMIGTALNFLVMSVVLIMLANPKGDLQDTFIQKVKFISSHGLFAIWIGYGLVFALATLGRIRIARPFLGLAVLAVVLTPLIPIEQNYFNDRLVFELSGAEQNGHDYGWQFGNYQLRGATAIREELEDDEEPLPNPLYPPEMGKGAVFFGGTDPGRFVPTYMIYSADVRPDVFLITQNALADNTFMSVTRDLYGDELWIPTPRDSENAFSEFVEDVRAGRRQANSDIVMENGRVQIVGALGVMEINGILCRKIFDHNKRWHDFFVEESYVIPWMYPYETPHGLIMKINSERTALSPENVQDDLDFWDWYVRRMTRDGRYRRDIVAQKSFSKLRSAIAGLYLNRGRLAEAERAYNDARVLYPVSPEATFRYIQDILMRQRRYSEALEAIGFFCEKDPNNDRGPYMKGVIEDVAEMESRLEEKIAAMGPDGPATASEAIEMAEIMMRLGQTGRARMTVEGFAAKPGLSVSECLRLASIMHETGDAANAARAMDRIWRKNSVRQSRESLRLAANIYQETADVEKLAEILPLLVKADPGDWRSWLALSSLHAVKGNMDAAAKALEEAVRSGGENVVAALEKSPTLIAVYRHLVESRKGAQRPAPWAGPGGRQPR